MGTRLAKHLQVILAHADAWEPLLHVHVGLRDGSELGCLGAWRVLCGECNAPFSAASTRRWHWGEERAPSRSARWTSLIGKVPDTEPWKQRSGAQEEVNL